MIRIKKKCNCGSEGQLKRYGKLEMFFCSNKKCPNYNKDWNYGLGYD